LQIIEEMGRSSIDLRPFGPDRRNDALGGVVKPAKIAGLIRLRTNDEITQARK
jgi:hypothetical protein